MEFVFVPGATVTLGWDRFEVGLDDETREDLEESFREFGVTDIVEALREVMSPVRQAEIPPMLVERFAIELAWRKVPLDDPRLNRYEFQEAIKEVVQGKKVSVEFSTSFRVQSREGEISTYLYDDDIMIEDLQEMLAGQGFSLPTEDEWEYLVAAGARTFFRWGDSFDYDMKLPYLNEDKKGPYPLQQPNQFGLVMAYDPYNWEVCDDSENFLKGGDGGTTLCGGAEGALAYHSLATYFRVPTVYFEDCDLEEDVFYRRIVRL